MTPFEEEGYTEDTKFKVLRGLGDLKEGDIVTLDKDDGTILPYFKTEDSRESSMWLPNMTPEGYEGELEVYEEPNKDLTPFEKAGYTKDTKFRVLRDYDYLKKGDIVTLAEDDGFRCPWFKTEDGNWGSMWLPGMVPKDYDEHLEVYEGEDVTQQDIPFTEELLLPINNSLEDMEDKDLINFLKINHKLVGQILEKLNNGKT